MAAHLGMAKDGVELGLLFVFTTIFAQGSDHIVTWAVKAGVIFFGNFLPATVRYHLGNEPPKVLGYLAHETKSEKFNEDLHQIFAHLCLEALS